MIVHIVPEIIEPGGGGGGRKRVGLKKKEKRSKESSGMNGWTDEKPPTETPFLLAFARGISCLRA